MCPISFFKIENPVAKAAIFRVMLNILCDGNPERHSSFFAISPLGLGSAVFLQVAPPLSGVSRCRVLNSNATLVVVVVAQVFVPAFKVAFSYCDVIWSSHPLEVAEPVGGH